MAKQLMGVYGIGKGVFFSFFPFSIFFFRVLPLFWFFLLSPGNSYTGKVSCKVTGHWTVFGGGLVAQRLGKYKHTQQYIP